jgi:adenylate cyclase
MRAVDHVRVKGKHERTEIFEVLGDRDYRQTAEQASFCVGLEAYRRRDFKGAAGHFRRGQAGDPLCGVFANRCEQLVATPPALDWDGVWHLSSK